MIRRSISRYWPLTHVFVPPHFLYRTNFIADITNTTNKTRYDIQCNRVFVYKGSVEPAPHRIFQVTPCSFKIKPIRTLPFRGVSSLPVCRSARLGNSVVKTRMSRGAIADWRRPCTKVQSFSSLPVRSILACQPVVSWVRGVRLLLVKIDKK